MLSPFSQTLCSTVLIKESTSLLSFFFRHAASNYCATASTEMGILVNTAVVQCTFFRILASLLHCIELNVPRTISSIKNSYDHISQGLQN